MRHLPTSLEEWVRYPAPDVQNLMQGEGYANDLLVRTANTTVLYMPSSPDWSRTCTVSSSTGCGRRRASSPSRPRSNVTSA